MSLLLVMLGSRAWPAAGPSYINFGDEFSGVDTFPSSDGRCLVSPFVAPVTGTVISIVAYFNNPISEADTPAKMVILADSSGDPGSVLGVTPEVTVEAGAGWFGGAVSVAVTESETYWLGTVCDDFNLRMVKRDGTPGTAEMANGTFNYATPPGTWPGTDGTYGGQMCVYAVIEY